KATGGEVELQSLHWNVKRLEIEANGLTIRGLEPAGDVPLAHADRLYVQLRVVSFLKTAIDLSQLTLEQPVIHLIVKPDGSTNVPEPQVKTSGDPIQQLFDLAGGKVELRHGALLLNQQKLPLDFKAADAEFSLSQNRIEVRSLKLSSQKSSVELSGTIDDFKHPRLQLNYGATIDLAQA